MSNRTLFAPPALLTLALLLSPSSAAAFSGPGSGTPEDPYQISDCDQLQEMELDPAAAYALAADVDCNGTALWNGGLGFVPVGSQAGPFTGSLDGHGHTVSGLTFNRPGESRVGLFSTLDGEVRDLHLAAVDLVTGHFSGPLAGYLEGGLVDGVSAAGSLAGGADVGGLIGRASGGVVRRSCSAVVVSGRDGVGGLLGAVDGTTRVERCCTTGEVTGTSYAVGGLVGWTYRARILDSHTSGAVVGNTSSFSYAYAGGLVGWHMKGQIFRSYATGDVSTGGGEGAGALVGGHDEGLIADSYATGAVTSTGWAVGGLVGYQQAAVARSYATGQVTGGTETGGLAGWTTDGYSTPTILDSFTAGSAAGAVPTGGLAGFDEGLLGLVGGSYWVGAAGTPCLGNLPHPCDDAPFRRDEASFFRTIANPPLNGWDFENVWSPALDGVGFPPLRGDGDDDGFPSPGDCDDADPDRHPGAEELRHDGVDQDCNGSDLTVEVTEASYDTRKDALSVRVTSAWGAAAELSSSASTELVPWAGSRQPGLTIGASALPVTDTLEVPAPCDELVSVRVDVGLPHDSYRDLLVDLTSPAGTTVTLHNFSYPALDPPVRYPDDRPPDGPGSLGDLTGEPGAGTWSLTVFDSYPYLGYGNGTLSTWGLELECRNRQPMTYKASQGHWEALVEPAGGNPGQIEVCGPEGCRSVVVSTWAWEQHQFAFVDENGAPVLPAEEMPLLGVQTGDTLFLRLVFQDYGDAAQGVGLRLRYYSSKADLDNDTNYAYVAPPGDGGDWEYWDGCAPGSWCDHGTRLTQAVTSDHDPEPGYAYEGEEPAFTWQPLTHNSGCENQFALRYTGTHPVAMEYWFRYEIGGVTMPYSGMHYGGQKEPMVRTVP